MTTEDYGKGLELLAALLLDLFGDEEGVREQICSDTDSYFEYYEHDLSAEIDPDAKSDALSSDDVSAIIEVMDDASMLDLEFFAWLMDVHSADSHQVLNITALMGITNEIDFTDDIDMDEEEPPIVIGSAGGSSTVYVDEGHDEYRRHALGPLA